MIVCHACDLALADGTLRCPMCQRNLRVPRALIAGGMAVFLAFMGFLLWGSGRYKSRVSRWEVSSEDVLKVAQSLVSTNPSVHNPVGFSAIDQSTVENWDGRRWRVSGYIDTRPQPGVKVRTLYFAVLLKSGTAWALEDLQLQSMEFGTSSAARKN